MKGILLTIISGLTLSVILTCGGDGKVRAESRADMLVQRGDSLIDNDRKAQAIETYKMAVDTAMAEENNSALTDAYSQIARSYLSMDLMDEGRVWLVKAEEVAKKDEPEAWARYLAVKGRFLWKEKVAETGESAPEVKEAARVFNELYDFALKHNLYEQAIDAANMMTIVGNMQDRVEWGLKGIKAAEEGGYKDWLAPLWNNLGWTYNDLGMYDKALEALMEARRYHYIKGELHSMLVADWSVAHAYRMAGQLDSSLTWAQRATIWAKDMYDGDPTADNAELLGMCYKEMGEAALAKGNERRALAGFRSAKIYLEKAKMQEWDEKGYNEILAKIDTLQANLRNSR
jgi:tetratricopeptide (TPR) repeat protein